MLKAGSATTLVRIFSPELDVIKLASIDPNYAPYTSLAGFVLVSGPHGSGKNALVAKIVEQESKFVSFCAAFLVSVLCSQILTIPAPFRKALVIDCARIAKAKTEAGMVTELASQTGYW